MQKAVSFNMLLLFMLKGVLIEWVKWVFHKFCLFYIKMSGMAYYQRNREEMLNRANNYYENGKERLRGQARNNYRNFFE